MNSLNNEIIKLSYNGIIEDRRTKMLINSIVSQIDTAIDKKIRGVLVSLKVTTYENNRKSIASMVKQLSLLSKKINISISLIDYSIPLYQVLKILTQSTKIKLFKTSNAAKLFLDAKAFKKDIDVLIFDKDEENAKKLSQELVKYGYTVIVIKNDDEYNEHIKNKHYDLVVTHSTLNMDLTTSKSSENPLILSKKLISNLPVFMDTAVETLVSFTGLDAHKSAHSIKRFNIKLTTNVISAVMHFNGDIDGSFVLVFPMDIALIAMESLLGEKIDEKDIESIMDGVGEFCNIITGSTKTALSNNDVKVVFELPKKFTSLKSTLEDIGNNNGIWIDMQLAGKPFYMFITK